MTMSDEELRAWVEAYVEAPSGSPAAHGFDEEDPEDCWRAIVALAARKLPPEVVAVLAAGPLEDLLGRHGADFTERVEVQARRDPGFRHLLGGVWKVEPRALWARVEKARVTAW